VREIGHAVMNAYVHGRRFDSVQACRLANMHAYVHDSLGHRRMSFEIGYLGKFETICTNIFKHVNQGLKRP
jgi:hypothetical protein